MAMYPSEQPLLPQATPRRPGEGPARKTRTRALVFMLLALGAGVFAALLITKYLQRHPSSAVAMVKVAVAAENLPTATALTKEHIELVDWPKGLAPLGTFAEAAPLDGRVTTVALLKGEPIVAARLAPPGTRQGMAAVIPDNMRAMTVPVNEVVGVAGFIHPGDYVDVVTTMQTPVSGHNNAEQEFRSKIVLQNIKVLAVGKDLISDESKPVEVPVVTLLVTPDQSERLALASTQGKVQLTMRAQRDQGEVATVGVSPPELLGTAAAPVAVAAAPAASARHHARARLPLPPVVVAQPEKKKEDIIEVLKGDGYEERKLRAKDNN